MNTSEDAPDRSPAAAPAADVAKAPKAAKEPTQIDAARRRPKPASPSVAPGPRGVVLDYPAAPATRAAASAMVRRRHRMVLVSFLLAVIAPTLATVGYLYTRAADQYASTVAFSVRSSETTAPMAFFGALSQTMSVGVTDSEIIYEFIRSQQMVEAAAAALPLRQIYNLPENDVVFRLGEDRSIEDLVAYWNRMISVSLAGSSGLLTVEARAFDPDSALKVASFVLDESARIVNRLSDEAREDAVGVARRVVSEAEDRLRDIRRQIRVFRDNQRALDPSDDARATLTLIASLRERLAATRIELDSYLALVGPRGPKAATLRQQIESLERQIEGQSALIGSGGGAVAPGAAASAEAGGLPVMSGLIGDYEELAVELEFAQNAYLSAQSAYEQAQIEARRQSRFLSPHIRPTLSVEAQYPQRPLIALAAFVLLLTAWSVLLLIAYNVRDRR